MKHLTMLGWDGIPHLTEEMKASLYASIPAYQVAARTKGIPMLGSGAIFQVASEDYTVPDMEIPAHWPRCYGFDIGWRKSAAVWLALNRDTDAAYVIAEHYRGEAEPVIHAEAIKARGKWIRGAIDPAARGRGQIDGRNLLSMYTDLGLDLVTADNSVEAGIMKLVDRLTSGRLKIFRSCSNLLQEMRLYRRDEKGRVVKDFDHLIDALRYAVQEMHSILSTAPQPPVVKTVYVSPGMAGTGWMG
jgi:hypothetical protein